MQPQGLEALMQSQPAPQMNNPRLAAAMDVVSSDAEEQILDPRTLAMLKYKDALQAMQAADQMMASAQPVPTPPTVAERTKLAAEQGIAGLAQRLSPGIQQQGGQMAAQQAQQAMQGGGLPQLSAPNMAGMAGGGIVGYADGGAPTPTKVVPRPVPMGQPSVETQAAVSDDVARYIYNYTNLRSSMEAATDPQQKAVINQRLQEMQRTFSPDIVSEAHMKMSQQSGMAGGGIVAFQAGGGMPGGVASLLPAVDPLADRFNRQMSIDPEEVARTRADRLEELTGVKELVEQRRVEQERLRALDEAQFSPEKERSRLLRAALASGAQRGLGGFGMGYAAEEGAIANERRTSQQRAVADMDKTIAELRAMGLSQFEAENVARTGAEAQQQAGATGLEARNAAEIRATAESENAAAQRENARNIAEIGGTTDSDALLRIYTEQFMQQGNSRQESEYLAAQEMQKNMRTATDPELATYQRELAKFSAMNALQTLRATKLKPYEPLATSDPAAYKAAIDRIDAEMNALEASIEGGGPVTQGAPSLEQFLAAARSANPGRSDAELTQYYNETYSN